ncbi:MAG TPA: hemolysin family protein [Dictyobacter sp.]|jgi:putative hemolysin|nr:hemolysin family protein [Dictyobacter sp.]
MNFPVIEVIIIFVLILANGFFAASEIAIVSARRSRLQQEVDAGHKQARRALELSENPDRFLATVQIGITLISTLASAFGGASISALLANWLQTFPVLEPYANALSLVIVVLIITYFTLVLGELAPKRLALQSAEGIALRVAPLMTRLSIIARPIVALLTTSANLILRLIGQYKETKGIVTAEDIVYLAREGTVSGTVETEEEEFINRVFRFTDQDVSSVMMPRTEIVAVELGTSLSQVIETFMSSGYTRLPLYEDSLDNVLGVLYAKDLLRSRQGNTKDENIDLRAIARPPFYISEYQHVDDLLTTFRRKGIHMAIVIDEYSQVTGLVTLEDVLEELVGEIQDEYDQPEDNHKIIQREDGSWLVDAMLDHTLVREKIGMETSEEQEHSDYHTLAGMLLAHLGRIPKTGDTTTIQNFIFEIVDMDGRRIDKVLIRRKPDNTSNLKNQE